MLRKKVAIYVPSTMHDQPAPAHLVNYYVQNTLKQLASVYGGATSTRANGTWLSDSCGLISENVTICYAFCRKVDKRGALQIARNLKTVFDQEAISVEINGRLMFV